MPTDDAIVGIMARAIQRSIPSTPPEKARAALSALHSAGYLIISPLDTPEGEAAVERALEAHRGARVRALDTTNPTAMRAALRAAGGTDD